MCEILGRSNDAEAGAWTEPGDLHQAESGYWLYQPNSVVN